MTDDMAERLGNKVQDKKLYLRDHNTPAMAVAIIDREEGEHYIGELGGKVRIKTKKPPFGQLEWTIEGEKAQQYALEIFDKLNFFQQRIATSWMHGVKKKGT